MSAAGARAGRRQGAAGAAARDRIARLLGEARDAARCGRLQRAWNLCEAALALDPRDVDALCAYASVAVQAGRADVAMEAARRALSLQPECADAHHWNGVALRQMGRIEDAVVSLGRAIDAQPARLESLHELANAFLDTGDARGAEPFVNMALDVDADAPSVQTTLGRFYGATGAIDDAVSAYRRAIALDPRQLDAHDRLGILLRDSGDLDGSIASFEAAVKLAPNRPDLWSNLLLTLQCSERCTAQQVAQRHRDFGTHFGKLISPLPPAPPVPASARRLKVGYLSSNFRRHAIVKFFEPLLAAHDRSRFETYCYSNAAVDDDVTARIRAQAEHFHGIWGTRDTYVAAQIRRDGIDILVDLDGHTAPNRLPVFFLKPAAVQVTWAGYLGTTGVAAIDYRLTDARADPPGLTDGGHTEALWRLPTTAWCYRPYDEAPPPGPPPFAANGFVTFVSLNNPGKVTRPMLELWTAILRAVPASRLVLHAIRQPSRYAELTSFFTDRGVARERLALVDRQSIGEYLALYAHGDIALDTWPCAGGTTTCDALWMGVPVVSLTGDRSYSRTGASMLASVGLGELAAGTPEDYAAAAIALSRDAERLATLRAGLRARMASSCLADEASFARDVEAALVAMCERHAARAGRRGPARATPAAS